MYKHKHFLNLVLLQVNPSIQKFYKNEQKVRIYIHCSKSSTLDLYESLLIRFKSSKFFLLFGPTMSISFSGGSVVKKSACQADQGSVPGPWSFPGEGNGYLFQYPGLENLMDRGTWWATVMGSQRVGHDLATKRQQNVHILGKFSSENRNEGKDST